MTTVNKNLNLEKRFNINSEKKIVFFHIPKNGGCSIEKIFFNNSMPNHNFYNKIHTRIKNFLRVDEMEFENFFSFTFSRNPYTRFFSTITFLKERGNPYLTNMEDLEKTIKDNREYIEKNLLFKPQHEFIVNPKNISYIAKFENFKEECEKISEITGIKYEEILHLNKSTKINFLITPFIIDFINDLYWEDFVVFNYNIKNIEQNIYYDDFIKNKL